jgi:hypothetical protein
LCDVVRFEQTKTTTARVPNSEVAGKTPSQIISIGISTYKRGHKQYNGIPPILSSSQPTMTSLFPTADEHATTAAPGGGAFL